MTPQAFKYLQERIRAVRFREIPTPKDPQAIRALRKKLKAYDLRAYRLQCAREDRRKRVSVDVTDVLFQGDYDVALAAIKKFESKTF